MNAFVGEELAALLKAVEVMASWDAAPAVTVSVCDFVDVPDVAVMTGVPTFVSP